MGPRRELSLFLLCLIWGTVQSVMYNLRGEQALLGPSALPQPPDSILWKCNGNKVVEFTGSEENPYGSYEGRVTLNWHTAQLQISDLRFEDSGKYEYELFMEGNLLQSSYDLEVIEKVSKPSVTCELNKSSGSNVSAVLLCSVEPNEHYSPLMFEWHSEEHIQFGEALPIFLGDELDEQQYTCHVSNPESHETATFTAKDCKTDTGLSAGMVVLVVIIVLMVCVCLLLVPYFLKKRELACFKKGPKPDLENQTPSKGLEPKLQEHDQNVDGNSEPLNTDNGLHEEKHLEEEREPLLQGQPTSASPQPQNQLGAEKDPETEDSRVLERNDGGDLHPDEEFLPPAQNSANLTPEDGNSKDDKDQSADSGSDLVGQEKHNMLDRSNEKQQTSTTSEGGQEPNGSQEETRTNEAKQQQADLLSQDSNSKREEDQHKTDGNESENEDEAAQKINVVEEVEANNLSETSKGEEDSNLSQAEVTNAEDNQQKDNHGQIVHEDKVTKDGDVVETNSGTVEPLDHPTKEEDSDQCNQQVEEKGGEEPASPQETAGNSEDDQNKSESENEDEAKKNDFVVEEAEVSRDLDNTSTEKSPDDSKQNDKNATKGGKDPNLALAEETSEDNRQKKNHEESTDEDQVTHDGHAGKEAKASSGVGATSHY